MGKGKLKTEHAGAKNGGGHWGTRHEAKTLSAKARRMNDRSLEKTSTRLILPHKVELKIGHYDYNEVQLQEIKKLFKLCAWDWLEPNSGMKAAFKNSYCVYVAHLGKNLVGFARILSDAKVYGLIVDLMIDPRFRSRGFGAMLLRTMLDEAQSDGIKVIQLLSSKEGHPLYLKLGFERCPNESPGMIKFLRG